MTPRRSSPSRRIAQIAVLVLIAGSLAAPPVLADKVILFKNGKTIRAKTAKADERGWTRLEFDGGLIGVKTSEIAIIQDATGGSVTRADAPPNQASGGGGGGGGFVSGGYVGADTPAEAPPPAEDYQPPPPDPSQNQYRGNPGLQGNNPAQRSMGGLPGTPLGRGFRGVQNSSPTGLSGGGRFSAGNGLGGLSRPAFGGQQPQQPPQNNNGDQ
ncbi:MAG TPA: hypothetical protein VE404_08020 [Verrucomicrobiae bacterium]|nr:hypothetical protein [Verrucomicrobiae bacterium]